MSETPEQRARRLGVPLVPARTQPRPDGVVGVCGACGRTLHAVEGYYCPRTDCPVQPHAT